MGATLSRWLDRVLLLTLLVILAGLSAQGLSHLTGAVLTTSMTPVTQALTRVLNKAAALPG